MTPIANYLLKMQINPTPELERAWHLAALKAGPALAWRALVRQQLGGVVPRWCPEFTWKALPGSFRNWQQPFEVWLLFTSEQDKTQLEFMVGTK